MSEAILSKYRDEAEALAEPRNAFGVPTYVFFGEALDVARFTRRFWAPRPSQRGQPMRPGLEQVNGNGMARLPADIADQIVELAAAGLYAHQQYLFTLSGPGPNPMIEAGRLLRDLSAALEYLFDDGVETREDFTRERLASMHADPTSHDAMALALDDTAAFAEMHRKALEGLGGFDGATIDNAREVASLLRLRSRSIDVETSDALLLRNQVWTLLDDRIRLVRAAARFVFRNYPAIVRDSMSAYRRRQRSSTGRDNGGELEDDGGAPPAGESVNDAGIESRVA